MSVNPHGYIEQTIEYNGKRLTLIWDGYSLYVSPDYNADCKISALNNYEASANGNVTVEFS
jgi:hypothetical protein